MRSELSEKNRYHVNKYRYLELKYYCLQYNDWKKAYESIDLMINGGLIKPRRGNSKTDPVLQYAIARDVYRRRIEFVESVAKKADAELSRYILKGVTEGVSYDIMNANDPIPCSRDTYYDRYRKFFFLLDKLKK